MNYRINTNYITLSSYSLSSWSFWIKLEIFCINMLPSVYHTVRTLSYRGTLILFLSSMKSMTTNVHTIPWELKKYFCTMASLVWISLVWFDKCLLSTHYCENHSSQCLLIWFLSSISDVAFQMQYMFPYAIYMKISWVKQVMFLTLKSILQVSSYKNF